MATPSPALPGPLDFKGHSILITGGASGLGLATARAFAAAGAYLTIATIMPVPKEILTSFHSSGAHVQEVICDISDWTGLHSAFKKALAFSPSNELDAVAMFAAIDKSGHLADHVLATGIDDEPICPSTAELDVNVKGTMYTTALALHYFRRHSRDKSLIFVSSLAGYIDETHNSVYTASKFGVRGLWRSIRARADAEMGVRCNLIAPWAIKTPMTVPIVEMLERLGIKEGQGITFASEETVAQSVVKCVGDTSISARAVAIMPEGFFDIGDDIVGGYGGIVLPQLMAMRRAAGDFLSG